MTCLLRRLRDEDGDDFVVVKTKGGPTSGVEPLARNVTEAVRRACAEADAAGDAEALERLVQCCDAGLRTPYQSGEDRGIIAKYGLDKYVTLKVRLRPGRTRLGMAGTRGPPALRINARFRRPCSSATPSS